MRRRQESFDEFSLQGYLAGHHHQHHGGGGGGCYNCGCGGCGGSCGWCGGGSYYGRRRRRSIAEFVEDAKVLELYDKVRTTTYARVDVSFAIDTGTEEGREGKRGEKGDEARRTDKLTISYLSISR